MQRGNLDDLVAFLTVGRERSFTKAAARLGMSQSSLSHTIRELEARLGVRLLTRTTRSVAPTQAGERLLQSIGPRLEEIDAELWPFAIFARNPPAQSGSPRPKTRPTRFFCQSSQNSCQRIQRSRSRSSSTMA